MSQSIIAPQPKSKQKFSSIETNCKEGETKMLTAVPAEGYLALRQHRIILCAAPIFFQGCVSPLPCPHLRVGAFCLPSSARPSLRAREWTPLQRVLLQAAAGKKTPTAAAVNSTPFVRQYDILSNKWGVLLCQKEYQTNDIRRSSRKWL